MNMLAISGTAESMIEGTQFNIGKKHSFNLFCENENLEEQLDKIENYLVKKGWDNIVIEEQELLESKEVIDHSVLVEAFELAKEDGISGVVNITPLK